MSEARHKLCQESMFSIFLKEAQAGRYEYLKTRTIKRPPANIVLPRSQQVATPPTDDLGIGPGTDLHRFLGKLGIHSTPDCQCRKHIKEMNQRGKQWCIENIETILNWMHEEASKRGLPFPARRLIRSVVLRIIKRSKEPEEMKWAYGVTTVPSRLDSHLPRTLESLAKAGFDKPRLFVDGSKNGTLYQKFGLEVTCRYPTIRTAGNWILSLYELFIREPSANRFAIFQDDLVTYRNLRAYLERCEYPKNGYWNLYTFPANQDLAKGRNGWYESNQLGLGAVGLVFSREAVIVLLGSKYMAERPLDASRGWRCIDGGIVEAMRKNKNGSGEWKEYVHNPSLVQHTGTGSSMRNPVQPLAKSFMGEDFDALELLQTK